MKLKNETEVAVVVAVHSGCREGLRNAESYNHGDPITVPILRFIEKAIRLGKSVHAK